MDKMLVFLFLTLLLGVSLSQSQAAGDEGDGVNGLDIEQEGTDLELQDIRSKRKLEKCVKKCKSKGGLCLKPGQSDDDCDQAQTITCGADSCNCCHKCSAPTSPCESDGGKCMLKGSCYLDQFYDKRSKCTKKSPCRCCRRCETPSTCSNPNGMDGMAECVGNKKAGKMPEYYPNKGGKCKKGQKCYCFNKCQNIRACSGFGGMCIYKGKPCKKGFKMYPCGCTYDKNCGCCVPVAVSAESAESALSCSSSEDTSDTSDSSD